MTQGKIERWHQTLKNRILLENYYLPGDLEAQIEAPAFRKPDTSCGVLPIRRQAFFEQTVFEGQFGHDLLQS
jgi:hypothetical protein